MSLVVNWMRTNRLKLSPDKMSLTFTQAVCLPVVRKSLLTLVHVLVISTTCCSALYVELSLKAVWCKMQLVKNVVVRLVSGTCRYDYRFLVLAHLHWLPVCQI